MSKDEKTVKDEKPIHKPHCAYLCSGDGPPYAECDCGVAPPRRLLLSIGVRSAQLLLKGLGRLDSDESREAKNYLGLTGALESFLAAGAGNGGR